MGNVSKLLATIAIFFTTCSFASEAYANDPPVLLSFGSMHISGNIWWFYGEVDDELYEGVSLFFEGAVEAGISVDQDGTFSYVSSVNESGIINATAYDDIFQASNTASDYISLE